MDLGNLVETVVYQLLIWGMACLNYQDGFPMVSTLVYVMHTEQDIESVPKSIWGFDLWVKP